MINTNISPDPTVTYTVVNSSSGDVIASGQTLVDAARVVLFDDGREYDIRLDNDGTGHTLWTRQQVANVGWHPTEIHSIEDVLEYAENDIFAKVIEADWPRHPTVITDAQYAEWEEDGAE